MFLGYATTFVNKSVEEPVLMDLKHLLIEAKQQVPPFLATLETEEENFLNLQAGKFFLKHFFCEIDFYFQKFREINFFFNFR